MKIDFIMDDIFSKRNIKWHCKYIDSIAMAEFNAGSPLGMPFSRPIIDVKEVLAKGKYIVNTLNSYKGQEWAKIVVLINSEDPNDINRCLTVRQIIEKLNQLDGGLEVCSANKNRDFMSNGWIPAFIDIHDGTDNIECEKRNIPKDYNGFITNFLI